MKQQMNSRRFTCSLQEKDPDLDEYLTVITFRQVNFPHPPLIISETECRELLSLLQRWVDSFREVT